MILIQCHKLPDGRTFALKAPYHKKFIELAHEVPGLKWNKPMKAWIGWRDAVLLLKDKLERCHVGKMTSPPDEQPTVKNGRAIEYPKEFRLYQKQGVDFSVRGAEEGCILADDMGLGKSAQALVAAKHLGGPILIVYPSIARSVWIGTKHQRGQVERWLGEKPAVLSTMKADASKLGPITCIHYEILDAWKEVLAAYGFKTVILDEVHMLQGHKSKRTEAAKFVTEKIKHRVALSGTPMTKRPRDLLSVCEVLSPGRFQGYQYLIRYSNGHYKDIGEGEEVFDTTGRSHEDELSARLRSFMLRRTKSEVALQLPPKTRQIIEIDVETGHIVTGRKLKLDQRAMSDALAQSANGKLTCTVDLVRQQLAEDRNMVVFTRLKATAASVVEALRVAGIRSYLATGDHTAPQRAVTVEEAAKDAPSVLVATIDSMGTAIDLSYASVGLFIEIDWVALKLLQAESRFHRIGQVNPVSILYIIGRETLDETIRDVVLSDLDGFEKIIGKIDDNMKQDLRGGTEDEALERIREAIKRKQRGEDN